MDRPRIGRSRCLTPRRLLEFIMSRLEVAEQLAKAAVDGAEKLGVRLLGDAAGNTVKAGEALTASAAMREPSAATLLAEEALSAGPKTLSLSGAGREAALRRLAQKEAPVEFRQNAGMSFVDGDLKLTSRNTLSAGRQAALEEKLAFKGLDVDRFETATRFEVVSKTKRGADKAVASATEGDGAKAAESLAKPTENAAAKVEIAKPAIIRPAEPQMPTKAFELPNERKMVTKLDDGSVLTEYPNAALPFKFFDPSRAGRSTSYGDAVYTVKQLPDGSITIGNPEGINLIGRNFEKARNTLGLDTPMQGFTEAPKWFQAKHAHMAESGVPTWMRGDSSWLYGQVNGLKGAKPTEAAFGQHGYLTQLKYDSPVKVVTGPFQGLVGDAMGIAGNGEAMLVNTAKILGERPETYIYKRGAGEIQAWTTADGRRSLIIPQAFKK